ncbi:MAG: hypothetical protein KDC28_00820 [Saprospiraceae bacterium]|nr:hypothetical protein [Saprospiraceae bacterium]MCB9319647.1 hypothetical protein [Lewinellaceae bacterium]
MKLFEANIVTIMWRFYLVMAIVIGSLFTHQYWALVFVPIVFLAALLGVRVEHFLPKKKN